jgi:cysteinyl-tRNA synthetase
LHGEHLLFEGRKMSKSAGNVVLVKDLVARGIDPLALRFCLMENKYRSQMDLSWDGLTAANTLLRRWRESYQRWKESSECDRNKVATRVEAIVDAFCNDLNTAQAMILLRKIEKDPELAARERSAIFEELEPLLGLDLTQGPVEKSLSERASELLDLRAKARANKDFVSSDRLRDELQELGVNVRDTSEGQVWEIK